MNSRIKLILAVALVVVASGCTTNTDNGSSDVEISQTQGLTIDKFAAFPAQVPANTQVQLDLVLVNKGEATARNVRWNLENIPFEGTRSWTKEGGFQQQSLQVAPPNPETGQSGGQRSLRPTLKAPSLGSDLSIPYTINLNLTYDYSTSGATEVTLMSRDRYQEKGATRSEVSLQNTGGPVQLETSTRNPIVYYSSGGSTSVQNSRFCVTAKNAGAGDLVGQEVDVTVESSGTLDVARERDGNYGNTASAPIEFVGGRTSAQNCFYLQAPDSVSSQLTLPITVTADYGYQLEDSTSVTVEGRGRSGSTTDGSDDSGEEKPSGGSPN